MNMNRLFTLLVCTVTGERLRLMDRSEVSSLNEKIARGSVRTQFGKTQTAPLDGGLLAQSAGLVYPIRDDIPFLLPEDALSTTEMGNP
jgi:uncharacterized protein YbaR (Trm112 family)